MKKELDSIEDAIEAIRKAVPGIVVGAGSVRQVAHVTQVLAAGAQFGVSPGSPDFLLEDRKSTRLNSSH